MENYHAWQTTALNRDQFEKREMREKLLFLCRLGHIAPSSHNSQPWRFFIDPDNALIDVYIDRHFVLPASDVAGRQAAVSAGCAIENIVIGTSFLHAAPRIEIFSPKKPALVPRADMTDDRGRYARVARIEYITKARPLPLDRLYESIFSRKVLRAEFDPHIPLAPAVIRELESATDGEKTRLHIITDAVRKLAIAEFQGQADGFVINSPRFSKELGAWLLPNDTPSPLGMPGAGFGLDDEETIRIHRGLMGDGPLRPEDSLKFALAGKMGIEKSPFIGCITIPKDEPSYWIEAGRSFERMFLILESRHISVGIHAGIVEVPLVNRIFGASLGTLRKPAVLFRAGTPKNKKDTGRPHSPRLPIEEVMLARRP